MQGCRKTTRKGFQHGHKSEADQLEKSVPFSQLSQESCKQTATAEAGLTVKCHLKTERVLQCDYKKDQLDCNSASEDDDDDVNPDIRPKCAAQLDHSHLSANRR
ncbi:hypothetical protein BaRGS_00033802 [Batillaria attramentaria]|uniref:Uncharacterized protein n=1 Tax=Batillaria attramentaria TaxID=370345 RepID=A0ABD0JJL2_9CAEN